MLSSKTLLTIPSEPLTSVPYKGKAEWVSRHVLVLPSSYPAGHAPIDGIFVRDQVWALRRSGLAVRVAYPDLRSLRSISFSAPVENHFQTRGHNEDGVPTLRFHGWHIPRLGMYRALFVRHALKLVETDIQRAKKPALIHAHNTLWAGEAAREAKSRYGIPYVVTEHSSAFARGLVRTTDLGVVRETLSEAAAVIAVSDCLRRDLTGFVPNTKIEVIPNVVDTDFFYAAAPPPPRTPFRLLSVAWLTKNKRVDLLLRAFDLAFPSETDVVLEIGGSGPERNRLERLAVELGLNSRVRFLGLLSREEMREALWRSHAFALSSDIETFGVVLIEAMATGLPVVATRCGGPEDIIGPEDGFLVEKGNVSVLAESLRSVYERSATFDRAGIRDHVQRKYTNQAVAAQLMNLYERVVA